MDLTKYYPDIVAKYPAYVTKRELCEICHICPKTAYNLEQQGEIPYTIEQNHLIRSHKIKLTDILAYIVKQARFDERKNGGQTSNLYTLCSDLLCPDEPENAPVLEDDASDESPAVQPESAPADACNASDPTPGEQSATLPTADSYSFADGFETKIGRQFCRPDSYVDWGAVHFYTPLNRTGEQILTDEEKSNSKPKNCKNRRPGVETPAVSPWIAVG